MTILGNAPVWVWPLLALLLFVGMRATKDRQVPVVLLYTLPLLGVMGARTIYAQGATLGVWAVFAAAWGLSGYLGYRFGCRWITARKGAHVHLRGEWLTLAAVMVLFWSNFAAGVLQAVAPNMLVGIGAMIFGAVLALASCQFAGRAWAVFRTQ